MPPGHSAQYHLLCLLVLSFKMKPHAKDSQDERPNNACEASCAASSVGTRGSLGRSKLPLVICKEHNIPGLSPTIVL